MGKKKQDQRPKFNNQNPHNKLDLNKYHQLGAKAKHSESHMLHKRKRDLERLLKHKQEQNSEQGRDKLAELETVKQKLADTHHHYEKKMRKEYFLKNKYKQIMEIEMRKVNKGIQECHANHSSKEELEAWEKKKRYIKFYPKNLNTKPLEEGAREFQAKVMDSIEEKNRNNIQRKNQYVSENAQREVKKSDRKNKKAEDTFFIAAEQSEEEVEEK